MTWDDLLGRMRAAGLVGGGRDPVATPLTGGVSSDIHLVDDGGRRFVVKRALDKLRVEADWFADTSRNEHERAYIEYVASFRPDAVPRLLHADDASGYFAMEYLDGFANWKSDLLGGRFDGDLAGAAGGLLGAIHARSWDDAAVRERFDTGRNFDQLRVDPYLRATGVRHPEVSDAIHAEASRLLGTRECLVHGDYSPKNMLHRAGRLVVLDCEVAWFGDGAFDLAFLLNHLCLKALYHAPSETPLPGMIRRVRAAYRSQVPGHADAVEARVARLLPMLLLARVDGKSPVEYLDPDRQALTRCHAVRLIRGADAGLDDVIARWLDACAGFTAGAAHRGRGGQRATE